MSVETGESDKVALRARKLCQGKRAIGTFAPLLPGGSPSGDKKREVTHSSFLHDFSHQDSFNDAQVK